MPKALLAEGALELLLLLPLVDPKRPFADGASDVVLAEKPKPPRPVTLGDVSLDASLFVDPPKAKPVELACEGEPIPPKRGARGDVFLNASLLR